MMSMSKITSPELTTDKAMPKVKARRFVRRIEKADKDTYLLVIKNRLTNKVVMTCIATGIKAARADAKRYISPNKPTLKVSIARLVESRYLVANATGDGQCPSPSPKVAA